MSYLLKAYLRVLNRRPLLTQSASAGVLMCTGDAIAQFVIEKRQLSQYEPERGLRFLLFGTFLAGPTLRGWYMLLDKLCKGTPMVAAVKKIAVDQSVMSPMFLTVFLGVMEFWKSKSLTQTQAKIKQDFVPILLANYKLWPAAQLINFYFIPLQHRVVFVQIVAIFWNTYLSYFSEKSDAAMEEIKNGVEKKS